MSDLEQVVAGAGAADVVNTNFRAVSPAAIYGRRPGAGGLSFSYYGGYLGGSSVADGAVTLAASEATIYVVAAHATGVVTSSTSNTNWNNTTDYLRIGIATTGASTITGFVDRREAYAPESTGGMTNPMTTVGDLIIGFTAGAAVRLAAGTATYVLTSNGAGVAPSWQAAAGGGGTPAGSTTQIQYNNAGAFGAEAAFTYDASTNTLAVDKITLNGLLLTLASATGGAGFRVPHGAAPTSPTNGDVWTTTAGLYARINGATVGPYSTGGGASLTNFTGSLNTASPNNTVNAARLLVTGGTTHVDMVLSPKGANGSLLAHLPDSTAAGGNKRGDSAVDWQLVRAAANEVASGTSSTIAGGLNNRASATAASVGGGRANLSTGAYTAIAGGDGNTASNDHGAVGGGATNVASGVASTIAGGNANTADSTYGWVPGGSNATTRGVQGAGAHGAGRFSADGDAQHVLFVQRRQFIDATPASLSSDGADPSAATGIPMPDSSAFSFCARVVARSSSNAASWRIEGTIKRGSGAGTAALVGTPTVTSLGADAGASAWDVDPLADTTLGGLVIQFTGVAATNIKVAAFIETVEVVG